MVNRYLLIFIFLFFSASASAGDLLGQFVRLVPEDAVNVLSKSFEIENLCPSSLGAAKRESCREEKLRPVKWQLRLFSKPDQKAVTGEHIEVMAKPGSGLEATYKNQAGKVIPFPADQFDPAWTYGPWFDFTAKSVRGDWIELPKRPFSQSVWINLKLDWKISTTATLLRVASSGVYTNPVLGNIVFTKIEKGTAYFRKEAASDSPCGESKESESSQEQKKVESKPISFFYDSDGHLNLKETYTQGC